MKKLLIGLLAATALLATPLHAKDIRVGTGSETGNYFAIANDIANYCNEDLGEDQLLILPSGGSVANLLGMQNKEFSMGIVQEDVLNFQARRSPKKVNRNNVKIVTPLHTESVHLLIPKGYKPKGTEKKGWLSVFSSKSGAPVKLELNLLRNQTIGAWGGSITSAQALSSFFNLNLNVVETKQGQMNGKLPILYVSGYPSKVVEGYLASGKYTLVSLDYDAVRQSAPFYTKESLNYSINGKVQSVPTIGVQALLVGKSFRKASRNKSASALANCILESLPDLADDPDTNPLWGGVYEYVEAGMQTQWSYFKLPEAAE